MVQAVLEVAEDGGGGERGRVLPRGRGPPLQCVPLHSTQYLKPSVHANAPVQGQGLEGNVIIPGVLL